MPWNWKSIMFLTKVFSNNYDADRWINDNAKAIIISRTQSKNQVFIITKRDNNV